MNIFEHRENLKPYEYPQFEKFVEAMQKSFWTVHEFNFDADVKEFKTILLPHEREAIKRCMLAISDVENKVKMFWGDLGHRMPKPEIFNVGHTFANSEVIHQIAYSELLTKLGLDDDFSKLNSVPAMVGRKKYLRKYLDGVKSRSNKEFTKSLILFTLLVENVSLFSQFLIVSSFYKYNNVLLNISKVIQASGREEDLHGLFGSALVNEIRKENPDWFDQEMEDKIRANVRKAYEAELGVLDWILEEGELSFLPKASIVEYLKKRFNYSLGLMGYTDEFNVDKDLLEPTRYFDNLMNSTTDFDFFTARSGDYSKNKNYEVDELF